MADQNLSISEEPKQEILYGYCHCGCGQKTNIPKKSDKKMGHIKGIPVKFIRGHYSRGTKGLCLAQNPAWRGGKIISMGYPMVRMPEHPHAANGYVAEHHLKAEKALGKPLPLGIIVHHANGTRDSGPLVICQDNAYHRLLHQRTRAYKACGHASWRKCKFCHQYDDPDNLYIKDSNIYHRNCGAEYSKKRYRNKR